MPIYEFQCQSCSFEFESIQKIADPLPTECPECDASDSIQKKMSASGFQLKGGGWYTDGYSSKAPEKKKEDSSKPAEGSSSTTKEANPSKPKETKPAKPKSNS